MATAVKKTISLPPDLANEAEMTAKEEGKTLLLASHDPLVYESKVVDRVVNVRDGRIEGAGE